MYEYRCKVVNVVDGDTVDVDIDLGFGVWMKKQSIRLYGIDTPERTSNKERKRCMDSHHKKVFNRNVR